MNIANCKSLHSRFFSGILYTTQTNDTSSRGTNIRLVGMQRARAGASLALRNHVESHPLSCAFVRESARITMQNERRV